MSKKKTIGEMKKDLKRMLTSRFKYYCRPSRVGGITKEEHYRLAEALVQDLMTNEWKTLKKHLEYYKAQEFYGKQCWIMLERVEKRLKRKDFDIHKIYPLPDAIVHALLDAGYIKKKKR